MSLQNLVIRVSHRQRADLEQQAQALKVSVSELVRQLLDAAAARYKPATIDLHGVEPQPQPTMET